MGAVFDRLGTGGRWWAAEVVARAVGLLLLAVCAGVGWWVSRTINQSPDHPMTVAEFTPAALTCASGSTGAAFTIVGPGLFRRIAVPGRR